MTRFRIWAPQVLYRVRTTVRQQCAASVVVHAMSRWLDAAAVVRFRPAEEAMDGSWWWWWSLRCLVAVLKPRGRADNAHEHFLELAMAVH